MKYKAKKLKTDIEIKIKNKELVKKSDISGFLNNSY